MSIPKKAIRPPGTLHLTIGVMSLTKPEQVEAAVQLLKDLDVETLLANADQVQESEHLIDVTAATPDSKQFESLSKAMEDRPTRRDQSLSPPPLTLAFTGLKSMNSLTSTSFLYTPPTETTGRLYPFCQALKDRFTKEKLMMEDDRALKLHATILNTIYAGKVYPSKRPAQQAGKHVTESEDQNPRSEEGQPDVGALSDQEGGAAEHDTAKSRGERQTQPANKKGKRRKEAVKFDARELLNRYVDFEWARDVRIDKVAICEMGAKKVMNGDGTGIGEEYTEIAFARLP